MLTYPFVGEKVHDQLGLEADDPRRTALRVANPLSEEAPLMRTSVLSTLLEALRRNISRGQRDVALFEVGLVTRPELPLRVAPVPGVDARPDDETLQQILAAVPHQPRRVALVLAGDADRGGWWGPGRPADWSDAVGAARALGAALAVDLTVTADEHAHGTPAGAPGSRWPTGRWSATRVSCTPRRSPPSVCRPGPVPPSSTSTCSAPPATRWSRRAGSRPTPWRTATSPSSSRRTSRPARSRRRCAEGTGDLLESLSLFDVYTGDQVGDQHRSLAYRMEFRAPDRTLTTEEVNGLRDRAIASAAAATGAVQRGA